MQITGAQIAAARMLGGLNQKEVASGASVSSETISKIERGDSTGNPSTLSKIHLFFTSVGIEFTENEGVRKAQGIRYLRGSTAIIEFLDDVHRTIQKHGGDIFLRNAPDHEFMKWTDVMEFSEFHMERMKKLKNYKFRILTEEGDASAVSSKYAEYRWIPKQYHGTMPIYGYGPKCAMLILKQNPSIYMINDSIITEGFRQEFNILWNLSNKMT